MACWDENILTGLAFAVVRCKSCLKSEGNEVSLFEASTVLPGTGGIPRQPSYFMWVCSEKPLMLCKPSKTGVRQEQNEYAQA